MKKFLFIILTLFVLCPAAFADEYVTMLSPDGEEVSVYRGSVGQYRSMGYSAGEEEKYNIWSRSATSGSKCVVDNAIIDTKTYAHRYFYPDQSSWAITNGKKMYYFAENGAYGGVDIKELDVDTGAGATIGYFGQNMKYELLICYDGKLYFIAVPYSSYNYDGAATYSFDLATGEILQEKNVASALGTFNMYSYEFAYDSKVVFVDYGNQEYIHTYTHVYDVVNGTVDAIFGGEGYSFLQRVSPYYDGMFFVEPRNSNLDFKVSYYNFNSQEKYDVCYTDDLIDAIDIFAVTNSYIVYNIINVGYDDIKLDYYVHFYGDPYPRKIPMLSDVSGSIQCIIDEDNVIYFAIGHGVIHNIYGYDGYTLKFLKECRGEPIQIANDYLIYFSDTFSEYATVRLY